MDIDEIKANCHVYICRRIDDVEDVIYRQDRFKDSVWSGQGINLHDMSWNLLGKYFITDHIKYSPIKRGVEPWNNNLIVNPFDTIGNFELKTNYLVAYVPLDKIHRITFPISLEGQAQKDFIAKTNIEPKPIANKNGLIVYGELLIEHKPTILNYWHVQFLTKNHEKVELKKITSTKVKDYLKSDILGKFARTGMDKHCSEINLEYFLAK